jgi:hydrogenase maturation protein HypF
MPGGERAISEPWRMACAWLASTDAGVPDSLGGSIPTALRGVVDQRRWSLVTEMVRSGLRSPVTTSMGRLFDAAAALCGLRAEVNYEGQAAIELEAACDPAEHGAYEIALLHNGELLEMNPSDALSSLTNDIASGATTGAVAARFHAGIVNATVTACAALASSAGTETVVLAGGVFQNRRLLEGTAAGLHAAGVRVLIPERLPAGDGAISYGQAVIAARWQTTAGGVPSAADVAGTGAPAAV